MESAGVLNLQSMGQMVPTEPWNPAHSAPKRQEIWWQEAVAVLPALHMAKTINPAGQVGNEPQPYPNMARLGLDHTPFPLYSQIRDKLCPLLITELDHAPSPGAAGSGPAHTPFTTPTPFTAWLGHAPFPLHDQVGAGPSPSHHRAGLEPNQALSHCRDGSELSQAPSCHGAGSG